MMQLPSEFKDFGYRDVYDSLFEELLRRINGRAIKAQEGYIDYYKLIQLPAMFYGTDVTTQEIIQETDRSRQCYQLLNARTFDEFKRYAYVGAICHEYYLEDLVWINTNHDRFITRSSFHYNLIILMNQLYKAFTDIEPHLDFEYSLLCKSPQDLENAATENNWFR